MNQLRYFPINLHLAQVYLRVVNAPTENRICKILTRRGSFYFPLSSVFQFKNIFLPRISPLRKYFKRDEARNEAKLKAEN